jgi:hypothetical protein
MPAPVLQVGAVVICSHFGLATPILPFGRVLLSGQPAVTVASPYTIAGCALTGTTNPPCVLGRWTTGSVRVLAGGQPLAIMSGSSTCVAPGTPMVPLVAQPRVIAT